MARHCGQYRVKLVDTHGLLRAMAAARRRGSAPPKVSGGYLAAYRVMHRAAASSGLSLAVRANWAAMPGSRCTIVLAGTWPSPLVREVSPVSWAMRPGVRSSRWARRSR